jgi:hypothetical protein
MTNDFVSYTHPRRIFPVMLRYAILNLASSLPCLPCAAVCSASKSSRQRHPNPLGTREDFSSGNRSFKACEYIPSADVKIGGMPLVFRAWGATMTTQLSAYFFRLQRERRRFSSGRTSSTDPVNITSKRARKTRELKPAFHGETYVQLRSSYRGK